MGDQPSLDLVERAGAAIGTRLDAVYRSLDVIHHRVTGIVGTLAEQRRLPDRAALATIRPLLQDLLSVDDRLLEGIGVAVGPHTLADAQHWLEWWRSDGGGNSHFIKHVLTPESVGYYDYQALDWFQTPLTTGRASATGPYIDAGGIEICTVTLGLPIFPTTGGGAVIGADLSIRGLESLLLRTLHTCRQQVLLLAKNGRVIVSNSARHVTGARLHLAEGETIVHAVPVPSLEPHRLPWQVVGLAGGGTN